MKLLSSILLVLLAAILLWQAGQVQQDLLVRRRALTPGLVDPLENTTPMVAFTTVALGGFRGLLVDMLWLRATKMQDEGKYFELVQLSEWITSLEPRFAAVWGFHAWNMAYNVSVLFNDFGDRWRWVKHGVELLRDKGLVYNPGAAKLYWELGWIFQHKIGQRLDQAHHHYKRAWAEEMGALFSGRAPDFDVLAGAARNRTELLERPGAAELTEAVVAQGIDPFAVGFLERAAEDPELTQLLAEHPGAEELMRFHRRRRMVEQFRLDPETMREVDEAYGPLDWRLPQAHAIYWAFRGRPHAEGFELLQLNRMIFQSMSDAFRNGSAFIDVDGNIVPSPNLDILPRVLEAYESALAEHEARQSSLLEAYQNFMRESISSLYAFHRIAQARELFDLLHEQFPSEETAPGFDRYIANSFVENIEDVTGREAQAMVEGMLTQAYFWLAMGDDERAAGFQKLGALYWRIYMSDLREGEHQDRVGLPALAQIQKQARERVLPQLQSPAARRRLEERSDDLGTIADDEDPGRAESP